MMLERRTNQGILRLIQPKEGGCDSTRCSVPDENDPVARNRNGDGCNKVETRPAKVEEANDASAPSGVTKAKPVTMSAPPAAGKTSLHSDQAVGKLTYNPITHAPSTTRFGLGSERL